MKLVAIFIAALYILAPSVAIAAESPIAKIATAAKNTTERIRSKDGTWSIPVASNILGSDTYMHHARGSEKNGGKTSGAFDVSAPIGTLVYAPCDGVAKHVSRANEGGYGNNIQVECSATGLIVWIGHLKEMMVKRGNDVNESTVIGTVGRTGSTSFNHIHITLRGANDKRVEDHFDMSQFYWSPFDNPESRPYEWSGKVSTGIAQVKRTSEALLISGAMVYGPFAVMALLSYIGLSIVVTRLSRSQSERGKLVLAGASHGISMTLITASVFTGFNQIVAQELGHAANAVQASDERPYSTNDDFEIALEFALRWEGWECTEDGAHTMGGITQGTYDDWRKARGFPTQDVCKYLKKSERKTILREGYWEGSGADELSWPMSATVFDMAIGSGSGAAKKLLDSGANDYESYQDERRKFYRSMRKGGLYIQAWLDRVDDLDKYLDSGKIKGD